MFNRNDFINWANAASKNNVGMSDFKQSHNNPTKQLMFNENTEPVVVSPTKDARTLDKTDDTNKLASKKYSLSLGTKLANGKIIPKQVDDYEYENHETELEREVNEILVPAMVAGGAIGGGIALGKKLTKWQRKGQDARATASHDMYGGAQDRPYNFGDKRREAKGTRTSLSKGGGSTDPETPGGHTTKDQDKLAQISALSQEYNPQGTELAEGILGGIVKTGLAAGAGVLAYKGAKGLMNRMQHKRAVANTKQSEGSPSTPVGSGAQQGMLKLANMVKQGGKAVAGSDSAKSLKKDVGGLALRGGHALAKSGAGGKAGGWASKALRAAGSALRKSAKG